MKDDIEPEKESCEELPVVWPRKWISKQEAKKYWPDQICTFCQDPENILTKETCCTGCSKLNEKDKTGFQNADFLE